MLAARRSHGATGVQRTRTGSESFYDAPETLARINSGASLSRADGAQRCPVVSHSLHPSFQLQLETRGAESLRLQTSMQIILYQHKEAQSPGWQPRKVAGPGTLRALKLM